MHVLEIAESPTIITYLPPPPVAVQPLSCCLCVAVEPLSNLVEHHWPMKWQLMGTKQTGSKMTTAGYKVEVPFGTSTI